MDVVKLPSEQKKMAYALRPLEHRDIPPVAEIEREAFPCVWPPTSFPRELQNKLARYLVACEPARSAVPVAEPASNSHDGEEPSLIGRLLGRVRSMWQDGKENHARDGELVVGFVGIWYMAGDAHITSIGVRKEHRRKGVGELLLIGSIEQGVARRARAVTLEVRASNIGAYSLYHRYGFHHVGLRKGYYTDNNEDAIIMTTNPIQASPYSEQFRNLVAAHRERWGESKRVLF